MVHKDSTVPYGEVDGFSTLLGYRTSNAGCCKVMLLLIAATLRGICRGLTYEAPCTSRWQILSQDVSPTLQILLHPRWGSSIYPASMFVKAPPEDIRAAIAAASQRMTPQ